MRVGGYAAISVFAVLALTQGAGANNSEPNAVSEAIQAQVERGAKAALSVRAAAQAKAQSLDAFKDFVRVDHWTEVWPDAAGKPVSRTVTGEVWRAAIQTALDQYNTVTIPDRNRPYYLDAPLVLKSGQSLTAGAHAELRLLPGVNTCLIRNATLVGSQTGPVPDNDTPDENIVIEGGVWTTLGTGHGQWNGNTRGRSSKQDDVPGCHGVILLNHVRGAVVRNVTIRQSRAFGIHISNSRNFLVEKMRFEENGRDGIHVNGPCEYGVIRSVRGVTHDDFVALNAWEWANYAPSYGPIRHVLVEDAVGTNRPSTDYTSPYPDGTAEIRLLPGTKRFADGAKLDCAISDCVFRNLTDIRTVKAYDQPNLELGCDKDFCDPIGTLRNLHFSQLTYNHPGRFQIAANVEGLSIDGVSLRFAPDERFKLVEIGPMSATCTRGSKDPAKWSEIFSPDRDVTVRGFRLADVRAMCDGRPVPVSDARDRLVRVADQKLNHDYPRTTPRGGTGRAIVIP